MRVTFSEYQKIRSKSGIHNFLMKDLTSSFGIYALKYKINPTSLKHYLGYKKDFSINAMALSCHNNSKDIQANDDFYRSFINE